MARLNDWLELTGTTLRSLRGRSVSNLYGLEWPAARRRLIEEHLPAIEQDQRRVRRWARTFSALLYGLAKRLTPERRILFLVALAVGAVSIIYLLFIYAGIGNAVKVIVSLALAFAVMTFLLAMELIDKLRFRSWSWRGSFRAVCCRARCPWLPDGMSLR